MALILTNPDGTFATQCALCARPLEKPFFATTHFIGDQRHDLYRFSDAAMHWDCYASWPKQTEFAALYFETMTEAGTREAVASYWPTLYRTNRVVVRFGIVVDEVSVLLRRSGTDIRIHRQNWASWLAKDWQEWCHHPLEEQAVSEVLEELWAVELPSP